MELKFTFLLLFLALLLIKTNASDDFELGKCETDFRGKWPQNISDEDLQWVRNSKEDKSGPKFRIFTSQDVRRVQPNLAYHFQLEALDESPMDRFLISINPDPDRERKNCATHHEDEGRLQSLTDVSQHLAYNCFKYLINRQDGGHQIVPFVWRTPKCGCFVINAEILDENNRIYTHEDDEFYGLSVKVCVINNNPGVRINKNRRLKKRLKRKEKKHLRRRGKRFCCKKGIKTYLGKIEGSTCQDPGISILEEATQNFKITDNLCSQVFQACCEDEIVGKELFQNMSKKALRTKQKYQDLRQKMKAKKAKRRQRLSYDF